MLFKHAHNRMVEVAHFSSGVFIVANASFTGCFDNTVATLGSVCVSHVCLYLSLRSVYRLHVHLSPFIQVSVSHDTYGQCECVSVCIHTTFLHLMCSVCVCEMSRSIKCFLYTAQ